METKTPGNEKESGTTDLDWENRVLCSDGNCIGVIGQGGKCNECGKVYEGTLPEEHDLSNEIPDPEESTPEEEDQYIQEDVSPEVTKHDDWQDRVLCSDGNCIGVIGPDGCCKECGKPYEG